MAMFSTNGTLVGVDVTIQLTIPTAFYTEVHNLSPVNTYTVNAANVSFQLPPMRKLVLTNGISQVILSGSGAYIVMANSEPQEKTAGPKIEPTFYGTSGNVSSSPADNVTLEDTGVVLQEKAGGTGTTQLTNLGVTTGKLADLAVNFNKTGSGINQNPGRGAAAMFNSAGVGIGDTLTVTLIGVPVVYEFTNGGAPAPGNIGVDIPTINVDLPAKVLANQPLVSCSALAGVFWLGISVQSLIQAGTTLSIASTLAASTENVAPLAESRVGLEFHTFTQTALNAVTGYPIYTSGTIVSQWFMETTPGGNQLSTLGIGYYPMTTGDGIVVGGSGAAGNIIHVILAVQY